MPGQHCTYELESRYQPSGQQPEAIECLVSGVKAGVSEQILLGVTGSGKTFTMANVIATLARPALILAHNKTLAAQLYSEFKAFFPKNRVEYFVSYYDYYQPEAYVPASDTFIEKDAAINEQIEQMRLSATKSVLERRDVIIVATVSAIYGLGDPDSYMKMLLHLAVGHQMSMRAMIECLVRMQYERNQIELSRGCFRVRGDVIDIYPAESDKQALRVQLFDDEIERIEFFDPLTGMCQQKLMRFTVYPKTHYATPKEQLDSMLAFIEEELQEQLARFEQGGKLLEAQRLRQRTRYDMEMIREMGYCQGIENYSRYLSNRQAGEPPPTLFDYLPADTLLMIDESHVTLPQLRAMYAGDRSRKTTLVEHGFRLPSALDNRPLQFEEFMARHLSTVYVSATPGPFEKERVSDPVELVVRPTGLLDPKIEIRPALHQVDDLIAEAKVEVTKGHRVLVTTLTKRMAEDLTGYLNDEGLRVRYLHSAIDTVERVEILRDLRLGQFDVLVGINLLREGIDLPEVTLVAILDADKEGFLRSTSSLIQTIGRAARHEKGRAILYADRETQSMQNAIGETKRRRGIQVAFNEAHGIVPRSIVKPVADILDLAVKDEDKASTPSLDAKALTKLIKEKEKSMHALAKDLQFESAATLRDEIQSLRNQLFLQSPS